MKKTLVFDSADLPTGSFFHATSAGVDPDKVERLVVIDETTLAIANDDDFGIGTNSGEASRVWILRTKAPLY